MDMYGFTATDIKIVSIQCTFFSEISLKFVLKGPHIPTLVQIMLWCQPSEQMMAEVGGAYMHHSASMS